MSHDPSTGFRAEGAVHRLAGEIAALDPGRTLRLMHVCGTHENALCQFGIRDLLPAWVKLVAGPGCPVCVCPASEIDMATRLALDHHAIVATFGDVVRVPARRSLMDARAQGGDCRVVYGIDDAIAIARAEPSRQVVFYGVGFETTACTTAAALRRGVPDNFSVLSSHRIVPPALEVLAASEANALEGYLLPGHVSVIIGLEGYRALARTCPLPMVVGGFEPVDLLLALRVLVERAGARQGGLFNGYARTVRDQGNPVARAALDEVFAPADAAWRGIGTIPLSGYRLRGAYARHDAALRFDLHPDPDVPDTHPGCRCGEVLLGRVEPEDCPLFGEHCHPGQPVGPCMVAFEGTCHARFRHGAQSRRRQA